ncbi:MAG: COG4315 family predicted lipoprotein [Streptosporangiales bacterium]
MGVRMFFGAGIAALVLAAGAACGGGSGSQQGGSGSAATVALAGSDYGKILTGKDGKTLYMYDPDKQGKSTCYGGCASAWPPLTVKSDPVAGKGVRDKLLGTVKRKDGSKQVTYNDWPLYYWANDSSAGDVTGQGVDNIWWVVRADGKPVRKPA